MGRWCRWRMLGPLALGRLSASLQSAGRRADERRRKLIGSEIEKSPNVCSWSWVCAELRAIQRAPRSAGPAASATDAPDMETAARSCGRPQFDAHWDASQPNKMDARDKARARMLSGPQLRRSDGPVMMT